MGITTKDNNLFRFVHLTPARLTDELKEKIKTESRDPHSGTTNSSRSRTIDSAITERQKLKDALRDLRSVDLSRDVHRNTRPSTDVAHNFLSLNSNGLTKLSENTLTTLRELNLDVSKTPVNKLLDILSGAVEASNNSDTVFEHTNQQPTGKIQSVGIANLLVVKQQIKRYEPAEIAHIENVLSFESKVRTHDELTRIEEISSTTTERSKDTETELTQTERFELNKQTAKTFQKDT
ncbi:MAG: hypothetical protein KZQ96_20605 [Candidatus Thiodiazotropha sp. (ex Lucinoma borealis)]|nr:hypothetical protein [Candidatus Thiodiazotropha sp. (ex Lucinoma borealis)]